MVSPHPAWEDTDRGYVRGETELVVYPLRVETAGEAFFERVVDEWEEANALGVRVVYRRRTAAEGTRVLARFTALRTAWEFANLLTHFFEGRDGLRATAELRADGEGGIPRVVSDLTAGEVLARLARPRPLPDEIRDLIDADVERRVPAPGTASNGQASSRSGGDS